MTYVDHSDGSGLVIDAIDDSVGSASRGEPVGERSQCAAQGTRGKMLMVNFRGPGGGQPEKNT
jgi:hypothetical protein